MIKNKLAHISKLKLNLKSSQNKMVNHPIFETINNIEETKIFMKSHVFAVWDFMSLLKTLQREITCVTLPWLPKRNTKMVYLINSIVLGEESDDFDSHDAEKATSHFDLYKYSMKEIGSCTKPIDFFIDKLGESHWSKSLEIPKRKMHEDKSFST